MFIDITLKITPKMATDAQGNEKKALSGHLGTHFDVMNKEFPLEYVERKGIVFDVSHVSNREIGLEDIDVGKIQPDMFVAFHSGFIEREGYGSAQYFTEHPQLARELIEVLLAKRTSIIGVDFAGLRRGREHTSTDQYCADHGVFVVENLCNLGCLLDSAAQREFTANTYPLNYAGMSGLPCRVVARV